MNDFFKQPRIKKLRRMAGGSVYTIIYLKMQLLSLQDDGKLFYEGIEDEFAEELALNIDEEPEDVKMTILYLIQQGLLIEGGNDDYILPETKNLIGTTAPSTIRSQKSRHKAKLLQCNTDATIRNTEIEIEKELEKELKDIVQVDCTSPTPISPTKELIIQNDLPSFDVKNAFNSFWEAYPRHVNKAKALEKFKVKCKTKMMYDCIMTGLKKQKPTKQWQEIQYIPHPTTWLNGERWNDEIIENQLSNSKDKVLPAWFNDENAVEVDTSDFDQEELEANLKALRGE